MNLSFVIFQQHKFHSLCHDLSFQCRFLFVLCLWYIKQTVMLITYSFFYVLQHGQWKCNDPVAEVFNILATSRSCGNNIHCSYQHYQPGKITLQISVLIIEYFRGGSRVSRLMQMTKSYILPMKYQTG